MIEEKFVEIRDAGTLIPALAFSVSASIESERWLMERAGFGRDVATQMEYVFLLALESGRANWDPFEWPENPRTLRIAHLALAGRLPEQFQERGNGVAFDVIESGDVLDVEYVLGLKDVVKKSERLTSKY